MNAVLTTNAQVPSDIKRDGKMTAVRIAGLDSGKSRDSSALVGVHVEDGVVKILNAKRWLGRNYIDVENEIARIHRLHPFQFLMVEINSVGAHVYEVLKYKHNLPAFPVTTSKDIKDLKKQAGEKTMDKNAMVKLMLEWFADERLVFPISTNSELDELKRQLSIFAEHRTESGNISYYAEGSEHDDLVMALMLACFKARVYMRDRKRHVTVANKKYTYGDKGTGDLLGTGVAPRLRGIESRSWVVRMPR